MSNQKNDFLLFALHFQERTEASRSETHNVQEGFQDDDNVGVIMTLQLSILKAYQSFSHLSTDGWCFITATDLSLQCRSFTFLVSTLEIECQNYLAKTFKEYIGVE